jgi:hypothetical protein
VDQRRRREQRIVGDLARRGVEPAQEGDRFAGVIGAREKLVDQAEARGERGEQWARGGVAGVEADIRAVAHGRERADLVGSRRLRHRLDSRSPPAMCTMHRSTGVHP